MHPPTPYELGLTKTKLPFGETSAEMSPVTLSWLIVSEKTSESLTYTLNSK